MRKLYKLSQRNLKNQREHVKIYYLGEVNDADKVTQIIGTNGGGPLLCLRLTA